MRCESGIEGKDGMDCDECDDGKMPAFECDETKLLRAASKNDLAKVKKLLAKGKNPNKCSFYGCTPLHIAASHDNVEIAKALLDAGADIYAHGELASWHPAKDVDGYPMFAAATRDCVNVARLLLEAGYDVDRREMEECTALMYCMIVEAEEVAKLLIEHGADVNASVGRWHPFVYASDELRKIMLKKGADIDWDGIHTAKVWARDIGNRNISKSLNEDIENSFIDRKITAKMGKGGRCILELADKDGGVECTEDHASEEEAQESIKCAIHLITARRSCISNSELERRTGYGIGKAGKIACIVSDQSLDRADGGFASYKKKEERDRIKNEWESLINDRIAGFDNAQ